jgi:leucyl aminopeptidase
MEDTRTFIQPVQFKASTTPTGDLQVSISLTDEDFTAVHGEAALADFKLDKIFRTTKDGVRHVVLRHEGEFTAKQIPALSAKVVAECQRVKAQAATLVLPEAVCENGFSKFAFCVNLANYRFDLKSSDVGRKSELGSLTLVHSKAEAFIASDRFQTDYQVSVHKNLCRDLHNTRPNVATVHFFVEKAREFAAEQGDKVKLTVFEGQEELLKEGLRLIHAVGKGSIQPPALVNLSYKGNPDSEEYISLVGKGIVYDQGGVNCKTSMLELMWTDKGGACSCFAAFQCAVRLGLKVNVVCSLALAENIVSGSCYRTSDIITSHKGLTVEILNTDAEGRLVLCDAMSWVQKNFKVNTLIDVATLTGAIMVALGKEYTGLFATHDDFAASLTEAGSSYYEALWRMPFCESITEMVKGKHTDLKNLSGSPFGGSIAAAVYLKAFVDPGVKFAHFDIAGSADVPAQKGLYAEGSTGTAVGTIVNYLKSQVKQ